jgi:hypothetical protein
VPEGVSSLMLSGDDDAHIGKKETSAGNETAVEIVGGNAPKNR